MYFPQESLQRQIEDFLKNADTYSDDVKIHIIENFLRKLKLQPSIMQMGMTYEIDLLLEKYKSLLMNQQDADFKCIKELAEEESIYRTKLKDIMMDLDRRLEGCSCISPDVKSYKDLYIFILSHPQNNSNVVVEILSRINYLDKMTRDVTFVMPGYKRPENDDEVCNTADRNLQLTFDENVFIDIIQDLEDKSEGKFVYHDDCELLILGKDSNNIYDFDNFVRLNLNKLAIIKHIDAVKLIMSIAQNFRLSNNLRFNIKERIRSMLKTLSEQDSKSITRVFIAGSKKLKRERALLREELSKVANTKDMDIRSLTFEDFATSLTGSERGRQADYNNFIKEEANVVVFIFDSTVGEITEEEFDIAYKSLLETKRPNIFVYVRKRHPIFNLFNSKLRNIKDKVFSYHQEYYVEYQNCDELRYKFYSDILTYFENSFKE